MTIRSKWRIALLTSLVLVSSACGSSDASGSQQSTTIETNDTQAPSSSPSTQADVQTSEPDQDSGDHDHDHGHDGAHGEPPEIAENDDTRTVTEIGEEIINRWWYPETDITYGELSTSLKDEGLVSETFADWEATPDLQVQDLQAEVEIIRMQVTRFEEDNASFEVEFERGDSSDELSLTFLEFVKTDGRWQMEEII